MDDKGTHKRTIKVHEVWKRVDDNLILLKGKWLYWKEVSSEDPCGFVVGLVIFCNSTYAVPPVLPPSPIFSWGFVYQTLQGCSANECNAALDPELSPSQWEPVLQVPALPPGEILTWAASICSREGVSTQQAQEWWCLSLPLSMETCRRVLQGHTKTTKPSRLTSVSWQHCPVTLQLVKKVGFSVGWKQMTNTKR